MHLIRFLKLADLKWMLNRKRKKNSGSLSMRPGRDGRWAGFPNTETSGCVPIQSMLALKLQFEAVDLIALCKVSPSSLNIEAYSKCNLKMQPPF